MRRDVTELKKLVHDIMSERAGTPINHPAETATVHYLQNPVGMVQDPPVVVAPVSVPVVKPSVSSVNTISPVKVSSDEVAEVQDTEEYVEEILCLDESEK